MGEYYTHAKMKFIGSKSEISMLKNLLNCMNKETHIVDFSECCQVAGEGTRITYCFTFSDDDFFENALLGELEDRGEEAKWTRYWPSFDLELAPLLFAALFPHAVFEYVLRWEYGNSGEDQYFSAEYDGHNLKCGECNSELWENVLEAYAALKCSDRDQEEWLEEWQENLNYDYIDMWNEMKEDYDAICDSLDLADFKGRKDKSKEGLYIALNGGYWNAYPSRNAKYEKSFFDGEDIQTYLVSEQIKKLDTGIEDYIKQFSFAEEQLQEFIQTASESGYKEMTAFLLEEKKHRVVENNKGGMNEKSEIEFKDKIFVLTGFDENQREKISEEIISRGGIIKSSTVLKTDYLILDEKYGRDTVKHRRAIELNSKGKSIRIIPGKLFLKLIK